MRKEQQKCRIRIILLWVIRRLYQSYNILEWRIQRCGSNRRRNRKRRQDVANDDSIKENASTCIIEIVGS